MRGVWLSSPTVHLHSASYSASEASQQGLCLGMSLKHVWGVAELT